jgi:fructose-1,6-bisphosphatase I
MPYRRITFTHFIIEEQRKVKGSGVFTGLLNDIATSAKMISDEVRHGALAGKMGSAGTDNVQGEVQKTLDVLANEIFVTMNQRSCHYVALASEEMEDIYQVPDEYRGGKYLLLFDPLDGSSNIEVNVSVGSIFSVLRCPEGITKPTVKDFLQPGAKQVCAGYALYGSSTMIVMSTGQGVNGFTLDQNSGEFFLTFPNMTIPADTNEFAVNMTRSRFWDKPVRRYIDECLAGKDGPRKKDFNTRWVASMVADVHRILTRGGIFMYPVDAQIREKGGRLRLMYEANPMSYIVEQAGGMAITGTGRILDVEPKSLHQRVPVILGSKNEVEVVRQYHLEAEKT